MKHPFRSGKPLRLIATCPEETKDVLAQELTNLGATEVALGYRAVMATVTAESFYRCHLWLRTASSLALELETFQFRGFDDLKNRSSRLPWHRLFQPEHTYLIDGIAGDRGQGTLSSNDISKAVRLGLEIAFQRRVKQTPKVDLKEPKVKIVAFVRKSRVHVSVNTTGKVLHKRGYKEDHHPAPLKETLAAACLRLAGYDGTTTFLDPMCGSGTLAIEAAYLALNKAPMIHRKKGQFGFEWLLNFDRNLWRKIQDDARSHRLGEPHQAIIASDLEPHFVKAARANALRARVEKHLTFSVTNFLDIDTAAMSPGILVTNLPYGDRLSTKEELEIFYRKIGDTLKSRFQGWQVYLLTAFDAPHKAIGLRPSAKIPIKNGAIDCRLLKYEIFSGKMDDYKLKSRNQKVSSPVAGQPRKG